MTGKKRTKRKVSIEKRRKEVFDVTIEQPKEARALEKRIQNTLAAADDKMQQLGRESNLERVWSEVVKFTDMNDMVRVNLQQIQVVFQESFDKYYERKAEHGRMLQQVLDKGEDYVNDYVEMKSTFDAEEAEAMKTLMTVSQRVEGMAKEYRQCALQKKWVVHIALVIQFKLAVESAIHRNVSDPNVLTDKFFGCARY